MTGQFLSFQLTIMRMKMKFDHFCNCAPNPLALFRRHRFFSMLLLVLFASSISNSAAEDLVKLKLLLGDVSMNKLPFVLAFDEGIYERNGLDVTPMFTRGSAEIIRRSGVNVPDEFMVDDGQRAKCRGAA